MDAASHFTPKTPAELLEQRKADLETREGMDDLLAADLEQFEGADYKDVREMLLQESGRIRLKLEKDIQALKIGQQESSSG